MRDARRPAVDWASARRRRWSASRIAAALTLHGLVLGLLKAAIDRVELPHRGADRATTVITVALHPAPPPPIHAPSSPRTRPAAARANAPGARAPVTPVPAPMPVRPHEDTAQAITLPAPPPQVAAATPPASSAKPDLAFLDNAATRRAIRNVARGDTLASHGDALTKEDFGSELLAADGSHAGMQRNLPPPPPAVALAQGVAAAHKGDCMKGEYMGGGMGLLSAPFLLAAEALGKCSSK
jgi:hypothetical protein